MLSSISKLYAKKKIGISGRSISVLNNQQILRIN